MLDKIEANEKQARTPTPVADKICHNYIIYGIFGSFQYWITSIVILIFNGFFYSYSHWAISKIGFHYVTQENSWTTVIIFVCLFADMVLLPFAIGMNLIEFVDIETFDNMSIFKGKHTDFGPKWYQDIGY